jgi:hypothetical protein
LITPSDGETITFLNKLAYTKLCIEKSIQSNLDEFVKSRHSGENRSPDDPQLLENTGFRLSPE